MKKQLKRTLSHPLFSGSIIVSAGNMIGNLFNYLFHLSMGRLLVPADYGILTVLISFISIFGLLSMTIATATTKFISTFKALGQTGNIAYVLRVLIKRIFAAAILLGLLSQFALKPLQGFLHIADQMLLNLTFIGIFAALLGAVNSGALQGLLAFVPLALYQSGGSLFRLVLAVILVYLGFGLRGAVAGFFLSFIIPYALSFIPLKPYLLHKESYKKIKFFEVIKYSFPTMLALGGLNLFISTDILLVKHFFSANQAGLYSALSVIGRVIFFGTGSIALVMFPVISGKYAKGEEYNFTFILSLGLVALGGICATFLYFIFPEFIIKLFYAQKSYISEAKNLGLMGIFFSLHSLANLFVNFFLSISKTKLGVLSIGASLLQAVLIWNFHKTLRQVIFSSIAASAFLVLVLGIYYIFSFFKACKNE